MEEYTKKQLKEQAELFVNEYQNSSDEDISKIIAGMTAIIEGNESTYEKMKNQKWFQRIWYGITRKNVATVKEMKDKRELLTKYTVQILIHMNELMNEHSNCVHDLYRALAVVRRDVETLEGEVSLLAHKLNEKIIRIDDYYYILKEIDNGKFNASTPMLSLLDIMSFLDGRTIEETRKMIQLKETMEKAGFDFSKSVNIQDFSESIFNMQEDKVGRILLFCQNYSNRSRFLQYTSCLIEEYFYQSETDRRIVKENGEAIENAIKYAKLDDSSKCVIEEMFNDLKDAIPRNYEPIDLSGIENQIVTPASYFSSHSSTPVNIIVGGCVGAGKTSLINSIFGWDIAATGIGSNITQKVCEYANGVDPMHFYDTPGIVLGENSSKDIITIVEDLVKKSNPFVFWYCIDNGRVRYQQCEVEILKMIQSIDIPIVIVVTKALDSDDEFMKNIEIVNQNSNLHNIKVVPVLAKDMHLRGGINIQAHGLETLIDATIACM